MTVGLQAQVSTRAVVGEGTRVWELAQVREGAVIGRGCVLGRGAYIGAGVQVGDHVKIQNFAQVYEPAVLEDGVFVGPHVVLTNDRHPRAIRPDGQPASRDDWEPVGVTVRYGASLGARSVCVAPTKIGRWAMVAAGAVVVNDVPDFALVAGSPARRIGWVGPSGRRLVDDGDGRWRCLETGASFVEEEGVLREAASDD
ncbi:MAG: UDP-2-acetamido-3-amino-2,3-dideoxy-glucuronate N-acetyltransferase [Nocardioidaceae bacterium]|nr:UDP-2-acetamido-3-amino-2,3-dideoxy-glucuronate N-acetyltransferase [Nocardioidaceae bacterium]